MKKYVSFIVVGIVILCGIDAVALPLNQANYIVEKAKQTPYEMNTNTTNLTLLIHGGVGVTFVAKNVGNYAATNVTINITISWGLFKHNNFTSNGDYFKPLLPNEIASGTTFLMGLGPINAEVTVGADNALPVTKTAKGIILFFFVIIK